MTFCRFLWRSLAGHWRIHAAVALGVAAATAVLIGALAVGDSLRFSLAQRTLDRLGRIDSVLAGDSFFRAELAAELSSADVVRAARATVLPAILLTGTVQNTSRQSQPRSGRVTVIGCDERFWQLFDGPRPGEEPVLPGPDEIVLNEPLARHLRVRAGEEVVLRIGHASSIPPDSPLGRKTETIRNRPLTVAAVIPAHGAGLFALRPSQQPPHNALVATATLQAMLEQPGKANALVAAGETASDGSRAGNLAAVLGEALCPTLSDYGLALSPTPRGYWHLTSERMLLPNATVEAALDRLAGSAPQPVLTYLANYITAGDGRGKIPYSTVTALDPRAASPLGPLVNLDGSPLVEIGDDEIVLNAWAVDDLAQQGVAVRPGEPIGLTYFEPESTHGQVRERSATLRLRSIVTLEGAAADRDLTPELVGVTDQASIANWDPPFPYDASRVRSVPPHNQDDAYWQAHKATPKAFVSLSTGRKLWSSRFGQTTSVRFVAPPDATAELLAGQLHLSPAELGWRFLDVRAIGLAAAAGTTPFDWLFLGFSLFIVAAAVMLLALLFRLGVESRASQIGILLASGWSRRRVALLLGGEGLLVSLVGGLVGIGVGIAYAQAMLWALQSPDWWLAAIATPFLEFRVRVASVAIGYAGGVAVAALTILATLRRLGLTAVRRLLAGQATDEPLGLAPPRRWTSFAIGGLVAAAAAAGIGALFLGGEAQAGAFFGAGACVLAAALLAIGRQLRRSQPGRGGLTFTRLAVRNGARNPGRSTLSIGLVASASFLIVATSAFRNDPQSAGRGFDGGTGGTTLVAEAAQPIFADLDTPAGRADLGLPEPARRLLADARVYSFRVAAGDDASCLNLYQSTQPRTLGAGRALIERGGFAWAASAADTDAERANPWLLLDRKLPDGPGGVPTVPAVFDFNTALYSLHLWQGVGATMDIVDGRGRPARLEVVGLLKNSVLQGDAIVAEDQFLALFPETSGYRFFLIESPAAAATPLAEGLAESLGDYGFEPEPTAARLARFLAVQNTYLLTFQSLGGLGLMLGTFGLAAVQLRNVLERRGELALLRAAGFRRRRLAALVLSEHVLLLVGGLAVGIAAALVAVLPHWLAGSAMVPWTDLAATLGVVLAVGLLAGAGAVRGTLKAELLPALRGE